jgi:DNA-binding CsgD family transcriptional regulator
MPPSARAAKGRLSRADLEAVLVIVRLAYEGLARREAWEEMLRRTRDLFQARDAFLVRTPLDPRVPSFLMADGVDPSLQSAYSSRFAVPLTNPTIAAALDLGLEGTIVTSDLVPWQQMERTEFFHVIRKPRGVRWEIGACGALWSESRRYLTVNRPASSPRFASREEALMDHLWPHLDQVLKLQDAAARHEAECRLLSGALGTDSDALLFLKPDGAVRPLNQRGTEILSENGRRPREFRNLEELAGPLQSALGELFAFLSDLGVAGGVPKVAPRERLVPLSGSSAMQVRGEVHFDNGVATGVVVRCRPAVARPVPSEPNLSEWGLTPREEEVARALLKGSSGDEICRSLGISAETLKTHLRHLCQKTETESRTQLVARLFHGHRA